MAEPPSAVEDLKNLRELLVIERRYVIRDFFQMRERNREDGLPTSLERKEGDQIRRLQEQIEAVDRAINDEELLSSSSKPSQP
jgi:hypothetical protein